MVPPWSGLHPAFLGLHVQPRTVWSLIMTKLMTNCQTIARASVCLLLAIAGACAAPSVSRQMSTEGMPPVSRPVSSVGLEAAARHAMATGTRALIIQQDGRILLEHYAAPGAADRVEFLASGTKSFACAIAAAAQADGLIDLDEPAATAIPTWRTEQSQKSDIRVRDLIALSHGLGSMQAVGLELNRVDSYDQALAAPVARPPGTAAVYGPTGFQAFSAYFELKTGGVIGADGTIVGGRDPVTYLQERVLSRIGARTGAWLRDARGKPNLSGGASFTARDWLLYGQFIMQRGQWQGKQLIPGDLIARCGTSPSPAFAGYGLGFWLNRQVLDSYAAGEDRLPMEAPIRAQLADGGNIVPSAPEDMLIAWGLGNMKMFIIRSRGLVIVKLAGSAYDTVFFNHLLSGSEPAAAPGPSPASGPLP